MGNTRGDGDLADTGVDATTAADDRPTAFAATTPATTPPESPTARPRIALEPGMRIAQYELVRELGRGGMGVVYEARDVKLGRRVAMKFLASSSREVAERFLIEARATARCSHDNIVIIHEVDELDGMPYMVLEHLDGTDLRHVMKREGRMSAPRVLELALPIARALARAHELGIIHRDLKPENVLVTTTGQVKVLDFGIAKAVANDPTQTPPLGLDAGKLMLTGAGALIGTLPYIAPEQMSDGVDPRSDLWALGVIMFEMLGGEHPVTPLTRDAVFASLFDPAPVRSVLELAPDTPPELAKIVTDCLAKSKADRLASATEVVQRLAALAPASPSQSTRAPEVEHPRSRWPIVLLGLAAFAIGTVAVFLLLRKPADVDVALRTLRDMHAARIAQLRQLAQRSDHVAAAQEVAEYLKKYPDDPDALELQVLTSWWSNGALSQNEIAIAHGLPDVPRRMVHGIELLTAQREGAAIGLLETADREYPRSPELLYALGEAYWHDGQIERGVATLERAFRRDPRWAMALDHVLEYRLGRGEADAVKPLAQLLRPVDAAAAAALDCRIAIAERHYADAARDAAAAIATVSPLPDLYECRVHALLLADDLDGAERAAKTERPVSDQREWGVLATIGELLLYRGRYDDYVDTRRGKASVQRSLALALWQPTERAGMVTTELSGGGMRQPPISMAAWILNARDVPPNLYDDYPEPDVRAYARGLRAELANDPGTAVAEYRKAMDTNARSDLRMLAAHHLARVLHTRGDTVAAAAACQEVIAPRVYQGYRAVLLPDCRLWSNDPKQWKRLVETWTGSFAHPAVAEARRRLN